MKPLILTIIRFILTIIFIFPATVLATTNFGIITAVPNEAHTILAHMQYKQVRKIGPYRYITGLLHHKSVVVLTAGAGTINTAVATSNMINAFNPDYLLFAGTAGGAKSALHVGDIIIVNKAILLDVGDPDANVPNWPDFPANPVTHRKDPVSFTTTPLLSNMAVKQLRSLPLSAYTHTGKKVPTRIYSGMIASTDHFPNNQRDLARMQRLDVDATDMETASMLKVCWLYHTPCTAIRGISNIIATTSKPNHFTRWNRQNELLASTNMGMTVIRLIQLS